MSTRSDYVRVLEIFLKYSKVDDRRLVPMTSFLEDFRAAFVANPDADEILNEMEHLDLIKEKECDHIFGDDGMEMLDKGWEILKAHRKMDQ